MSARLYPDPSNPSVDWIIETDADGPIFIAAKILHHGTDGDHILGGTDEIDGDKLGIDFVPTNYTRDTAPAEVDDVKHNTAHFAGIDAVLGTIGGELTRDNKAMTASVTGSDEDAATAVGVVTTPIRDGYVQVAINGHIVSVGDGVKTKDCYFADPGVPGTARDIADIVAGDSCRWVGSIAGYQLATTDRIDFLYVA